jgi:protein arginine N-methyltransferase 1
MYTVYDYGRMMCDEVRMKAFLAALEKHVKPGSVVADLGTGTGIFALVAAKLGARRVFAIDPNPAVEVGKQLARENGLADRVTFFRGISTEIDLPERADVIVSDMRGQLPVAGDNLSSLIDARERLLVPGGVMIPMRDRLFVALVEAPKLFDNMVSPWEPRRFHGLSHEAARASVLQGVYADHAAPIEEPQLLTEGRVWATLDYATLKDPAVSGRVTAPVRRSGAAHGLCAWFESATSDGIAYSTGPGPETTVYARMFLPLLEPTAVEEGDELDLSLRADRNATDHTWTWSTTITRGGKTIGSWKQSTFLGEPMSHEDFLRAADDFAPRRSSRAEAWLRLLGAMDGETSAADLAARLHEEFPNIYRSLSDALFEVKALERRLR